MKKVSLLICLLFLAGCAGKEVTKLDVKMYNTTGDSIGTVKITEQSRGVKLKVDLKGLPSGDHAIHIHNKAACKGPDFKSAGDHYNPGDNKHGLLHPKGPHAGDLPNLIVKDDGTVKEELTAPHVTLKEGVKSSLLIKDGTSLVIHASKDDGMSQPAGNSGDRIACGKITKK